MNSLVSVIGKSPRITPALVTIVRCVRIEWWPTLKNPWQELLEEKQRSVVSESKKYTVSKEDFKYVEMLKPADLIPPPPPNVSSTPSGWIAPKPELSALKPYTVTRSSNHMLPVYLIEKERKRREQTHGKRMLTVVRRVGGDLSALAADLEVLLKPKCESGVFLCQVDEATGKLIVDGIFLEEVAAFLLEHGF